MALTNHPQGAAVFWILIGLTVFVVKPDYRGWLMLLEYPLTTRFFFALLWQISLFSILCISAAHCVSALVSTNVERLITGRFCILIS